MESIIADALKYSGQQSTAVEAEQKDNAQLENVRIVVVGAGGAGNNTVNRMFKMGIKSAETIAVNTDQVHLRSIEADRKLLIGKTLTKGMGAGGFPEVGMKAAEMSREGLRNTLNNAELVFVCAGMGGGTGTGAAPIIAEVAKEQGAITVGVVTYPFELERARLDKANWGIEALSSVCDTVIVIDNNRLVQYVPNLPMNQAFAVADTIVSRAVKGISDTISFPSLVNIDFADIRSIMGSAGMAMVSVGEGKGTQRVEDAVENVLKHPLLDVDYTGAKGGLIHIAGGPTLTLGEANAIGEGITQAFDPHANVIWGARIDPSLGDKVVVTSIMTGVTSPHILGRTETNTAREAKPIDLLERVDF